MKHRIESLVLSVLFIVSPAVTLAQDQTILDIQFPVDGPHSFRDDFGEPRAGHAHEGIDILAAKMTPILAAADGEISLIPMTEPSWGFAIFVDGDDGYRYNYIHINNDTPGTDDGNGGPQYAYAPGLDRGTHISKGQLIGWVGDSGNAENIASHLHFEIRLADDTPINPYPSLLQADAAGSFDPDVETTLSQTINMDLQIEPTAFSTQCESNTLIKSDESKAVYYCGADGRRYVFPTQQIYLSWYADFTNVQTISAQQLASLPLGGNVTYRPGVRLVKIQTDPKVYAVAHGGVLRWVTSQQVAADLYGATWNKQIDDIPEVFFLNYTIGNSI